MARIEFFVPSTAWGGPVPNLASPHAASDVPLPWLAPYADDGVAVRQIADTLEPLLVTLAVAGYQTMDVAVVAGPTTALRLATSSGFVEIGDPSGWDAPMTASGPAAAVRLVPVVLADPPPQWTTITFDTLGLTSRIDGEWLVIDVPAATDNGTLRAGLHDAAHSDAETLRAAIDSMPGSVGLEMIYDPGDWAVGASDRSDVEIAAADITSHHALSVSTALADVLGLPTDGGSDTGDSLALTTPRSLAETTCDASEIAGDVRAEADCRALLENLQTTAEAVADPPNYSSLPLTTVLLDLEGRGLVDLLGPIGGINITEIISILAIVGRLNDEQIRTLATYLALGPAPDLGHGESDAPTDASLTDDVADRLAREYRYVEDAIAEEIVIAFISLCRLAPPSDDGSDASGTLERYVGELARAIERRVIDVPLTLSPADYHQRGVDEVQRVWEHWQHEMFDPKMVAGSVRLFATAGDAELAADVVTTALDHYSIGLDQLTAHWRTSAGAAEVAASPGLVGWGAEMFTELCIAVWQLDRLGDDGLPIATRDHVAGQLAAMCGTGPFTDEMSAAVETRFGELLTDELSGADIGSPDHTLLQVLILMSKAGTEQEVGERCDFTAVSNKLALLFADPALEVNIPALRSQAALEALDPETPDAVGAEVLAWILSEPTQAYLATLELVTRRLEEERLFAVLGKLAPELVETAAAECAAAELGANYQQRMADFDEDKFGEEIEAAAAQGEIQNDFLVIQVGEGKQIAKVVGKGVSFGPDFAPGQRYALFQNTFMAAARLRHAGLIDDTAMLKVHSVSLRALDHADEFAPRYSTVGNVVSVAVAVMAAFEMVDAGWPDFELNSYVGAVGLLDDVAGGLAASIDLLRALAERAIANGTNFPGGAIWTTRLATATKVFGIGSLLVNALTNGYAAYDAYVNGNYVEAGLYAISAGAFGLSFAILCFAPAASALALAVPFLGLIAVAFGAAAALWGYWRIQEEQEQAYDDVLRDHRLLYASEVLLHTPFAGVRIDTQLSPLYQPIDEDAPFAVASITDATDLDLPDTYADGLVYAATALHTEDEQVYEAFSSIPGVLMGYGDTRDGYPPPAASDAMATVRPRFEEWRKIVVFNSIAIDVHRQVGEWVEAGDPIITVDESGHGRTYTATYAGRLMALAPRGHSFDDDDLAFRIRSEGSDLVYEVVVEG